MRKIARLISMFVVYPLLVWPALYLSLALTGKNPFKYRITDIEVTYESIKAFK